jgi:hypothetical protein
MSKYEEFRDYQKNTKKYDDDIQPPNPSVKDRNQEFNLTSDSDTDKTNVNHQLYDNLFQKNREMIQKYDFFYYCAVIMMKYNFF